MSDSFNKFILKYFIFFDAVVQGSLNFNFQLSIASRQKHNCFEMLILT